MPRYDLGDAGIEVARIKLKYKDVLDFGEFYTALYYWVMQHDWSDEESGMEFFETYYGEKVNQSGAKEIWARWRLTRDAEDGKYFKFYLDIDIHCLGLAPIEIVKDGRKIKTMKGEVEISIVGNLCQKFVSEFAKNDILKHFSSVFTKKIYKSTIDARTKQLYHEVYELQHFIKQWLKLKRYNPYVETKAFYPSQAYPSFGKDE